MVKYVLTGATGGLGSQVLKHLLQLVPASDIVVSLYNPAGATPSIASAGVEVRHGDYNDPASLAAAFAGADKLLLVSSPSIAHAQRVAHHTTAIDAARRAGVGHVYYTSLAFAGDSRAAVMQAHLDTERFLKDSGLTYTILREGIYSESYPLYFGFWSASAEEGEGEDEDEVLVPHSDGGIAWVCREDLGEGTARIMVADGYENETRLLSGSRTVTLGQIAESVSQLLGRDIKLVVGSEDDYVQRNLGKNGPRGEEEFLRKWATTYKALERGELDVVDPLLESIIGRPLKSFEDTLKETLNIHGSVMEQYAK